MKNTILILALGFFTFASNALMAQTPKPTGQTGQQTVDVETSTKPTCQKPQRNGKGMKGSKNMGHRKNYKDNQNGRNGKTGQQARGQAHQAKGMKGGKGYQAKNQQRPNCNIKPAQKQNRSSRTMNNGTQRAAARGHRVGNG